MMDNHNWKEASYMSKSRLIPITFLALLLLLLASGALAASSAHYAVDWQVLSAGGAPAASNSGHVAMNGTLGQTAIGPSSGSQTSLWAGFWYSIKQAVIDLFLPIIVRGN
jgi:hypothetical protein